MNYCRAGWINNPVRIEKEGGHAPPFALGGSMAESRNYAKTRQMVDFNNVLSKIGNNGLYCIDRGVYSIIRQIIKDRALWRTTYYTNLRIDGYDIPDIEDFVPIDRALSEFLGGGDMSCNLLDGLKGIEAAIRAIQCGNGGGINAGTDGQLRYGTGRVYSAPTSNEAAAAAGFDDMSAYDAHKCDAANAIIDGLIASINNLAGLSLFQLVAGGTVLFAVGLLSNPPLAIVALVAGLGLATGAFYSLANAIDDNRQSLVCALYNSDDTITAYDELKANLSEIVIEVYGVEVGISVIVDMLAYMCNTDVLSALFTKIGLPAIEGAVECGCGNDWVYVNEYQPNPNNVTLTISGDYAYATSTDSSNGRYIVQLSFSEPISITLDIIGAVVVDPDFDAAFSDSNGGYSYQGYAQFIEDINNSSSVSGLYVKSAVAPFSVEITRN